MVITLDNGVMGLFLKGHGDSRYGDPEFQTEVCPIWSPRALARSLPGDGEVVRDQVIAARPRGNLASADSFWRVSKVYKARSWPYST